MSNYELDGLATLATRCLLANELLPLTHPPGWKREGFPLPVKRTQPGNDGSIRQEYRPMAVLEYVYEVISGELAKRQAKDRKAAKLEAA